MLAWSWTSNQMIAVYIAFGVVLAGVAAWLILRKTVRTRMGMERQLRQDPDINDWLVIFGWTAKVLYVPTLLVAVLASILMFMQESGWKVFAGIDPKLVGGVWFAIFFTNFLVEEYHLNIKILLLGAVGIGFLLLWLHLLGWVGGFLRLFTSLAFSISGTGYLLIAIIGGLTIFISWLQGLFCYVAITPNFLNVQVGPTEAGEQIGREDYNTKVDTSDFVERLLGFGRIIITFKEKSRPPLTLLVWRVETKAQMLEKVRAKFAIDYPQQRPTTPEVQLPPPPPAENPPEPAQTPPEPSQG
ncbi:MAG TPA: hypothetical protein PKH24_19525 [Sedimentisphaerales bacterium]|jgi:hypothetical protein|nr:hypothetical protein [Sedimentisphaerales bacterium]HNU31288.1 hypothetical protein [Sedimentisphaerales bacterium]